MLHLSWTVNGRILLYGPIPYARSFYELEYHVGILTARIGYLYLAVVSLLHTLQQPNGTVYFLL